VEILGFHFFSEEKEVFLDERVFEELILTVLA